MRADYKLKPNGRKSVNRSEWYGITYECKANNIKSDAC